MQRYLRVGTLVVVLLLVAAFVAIPSSAAPPHRGYGGGYKHKDMCCKPYGWGAPPVSIGLDPAWYVYYPAGLKPAADALGMTAEDLSNYLWAGGSLAHLAQLHAVDLQDLRNAVDGAMYRLGQGYVSPSPWEADGMAFPVTSGWGYGGRHGRH